jgi:hypothetical protein
LGRQPSASWVSTSELAELLKRTSESRPLTEVFKWRDIAAGCNEWRAFCGYKGPSATKETLVFSRYKIMAEIRHGTLPSMDKTNPKFQISKYWNIKKIKKM